MVLRPGHGRHYSTSASIERHPDPTVASGINNALQPITGRGATASLIHKSDSRLLSFVELAEMKIFFNSDKKKRSERQDPLDTFHPNLMQTQRLLAPLRSGTVAKSANLHEKRQV